MSGIDFCDHDLEFRLDESDPTWMRVACHPKGCLVAVYKLDFRDVDDLIRALQKMHDVMRSRAYAKKWAEEMAQDLHDKGWTFQRFSDTIHPHGAPADQALGDIGEELSRLDKEGKE